MLSKLGFMETVFQRGFLRLLSSFSHCHLMHSGSAKRQVVKPPDKGSFPLDKQAKCKPLVQVSIARPVPHWPLSCCTAAP